MDEASRDARQTRKRGPVIMRVCAILDRDLTIRSANGGCCDLVGESALKIVPPSHHNLLKALSRQLFDRQRMVCCEIPTLSVGESEPRWWLVRAAPVCEAGRVVAAVAHAVPRNSGAPADWHPVSIRAWERRLALRELMPILQAFDVRVFDLTGTIGCSVLSSPTKPAVGGHDATRAANHAKRNSC